MIKVSSSFQIKTTIENLGRHWVKNWVYIGVNFDIHWGQFV